MSEHLQRSFATELPHTALPLVAASKTHHWGLKICAFDEALPDDLCSHQPDILQNLISDHFDMSIYNKNNKSHYQVGMSLEQTLEYLEDLCPNKDCYHCRLPLSSRVLIADGGLWVFSCGHTFHGICLSVLKIKLCPVCFKTK